MVAYPPDACFWLSCLSLLHNEHWGTKSGAKANVNLDQEFGMEDLTVRLLNLWANTYQIFKSTDGMSATSAYKQA